MRDTVLSIFSLAHLGENTDRLLDAKFLDGIGRLLTGQAQLLKRELEVLVLMRRTDVPQSGSRAVGLGQLVDDVPGEVPVLGDLPPELLHHLLVVIVIASVPVSRTYHGLKKTG